MVLCNTKSEIKTERNDSIVPFILRQNPNIGGKYES
ncbi:MAG: hypothetical protein ACD_7C00490G0004 [uncultured bacterium]|nr:MAG: hypothetical protein ACD_7C00490G0004 [uncultured bacterium]